jgi:uncharacterized protein YecT (DUF1311 family)
MCGHQFRRRANNQVVLLAVVTCAASFAFFTTSRAQSLLPRGSEQPSFDCSKARTAPARLICADGELARLDGELGTAFQNRKAQLSPADASALVADELAWIRDRNASCDLVGKNDAAIDVLATSKPCLANAIQQRIASLVQMQSASGAAPPTQQEPLALIPPSSAQPATKVGDDQAAPTQHHASHSEVDVLLRAIGFALTGSDDADPNVIGNRANCVFAIGNNVYHLNNVQTDRLTLQGWERKTAYGIQQWVTVGLHGDDVVFEETKEGAKDDGSAFMSQLRAQNPTWFESHHYTYKEHELELHTNDTDRVKRAWDYIYSHGCTGKRSPF